MTYALIQNDRITHVGPLPRIWWDGDRWYDWRDPATAAINPAASGWLPVTDTARPADTDTTTTDYSVELIAGQPVVTWTPRPWTAAELAASQQATTRDTLTSNTRSDLEKLNKAIAKQATLLGAATAPGSIRAILGNADPAGTTSLRALKAQTNTAVVTAQSIKALIGFVIDLAQLQIDGTQASRIVARQVLREAKLLVEDLDSADVGADIA